MATPRTLFSDVAFVRLSLMEGAEDRVRVRGEFAKCGVATENRRVYPKQIWEKEIGRLNKALKDRRVFGEIDHPADGQTKLTRVSHIVTDLRVEDGLVIGEAEILPTKAGKDLMALLQSNVPIGVSSRGFGSVKTNDKNEDVVQDDFKLVTFDFVADPADVDAYPSVQESRGLFEGVQFDLDDEQQKALEFARHIEAEKTGKKVEAEVGLREAFASEILAKLGGLRAEVRDEVRAELLSDPAVAGAKLALEAVRDVLRPYILPEDVAQLVAQRDEAIATLEARVKTLEEENSTLASMAKEVGYRFYLERALSDDPNAEAIRALVGDVTNYPNSEALKKQVNAARVELAKQRVERAEAQVAKEKAQREVREAREAQEQAVAKAKAQAQAKAERVAQEAVTESKREFNARLAKIEKLVEAEQSKREALETELAEARQENETLRTKLYAESRIANHPKASKLRNLLESVRVRNDEDVDTLIESEREPVRDEDELQNVRARIRSKMRSSAPAEAPEPISEARQVASSRTAKDYLGLGADLDSLRRLSGINR